VTAGGPLAALALLAAVALARGDGWEFLEAGKPALARTAFQNQLRKNPGDVKVLTGLGLAELALGNADAACERLLGSIEKGGGDARARLGLARAFLLRARSRLATGRGDEEETRYFLLDAENQAARAAALDPGDPQPWMTVAEARLILGDADGAQEAIDAAEQRGLEIKLVRRLRGDLSFQLVRARLEEGGVADWESAKREIEALIREDPGSAVLRLRLGDLHHAFGHFDEALESWRRAFAIEPFDRPALETVLACLKVPELRAKARAALQTALDAAESAATAGDPRPGYALFCVGQARLMDRELDGAIALFKRARAVDPSLEVPCSLGLADAAFRLQRHDEAAAAWSSAFAADFAQARALVVHLGLASATSASLQFLADQAVEKRRGDSARDLLAIAWDLTPDDPALCNDYAFLCRETGRHEESWRAYSRLVELAPGQPRYLNDAALILSDYLKKDLALARSLYERAIAAADSLLADPRASDVTREMAASAKRDATSNLAKLESRRSR